MIYCSVPTCASRGFNNFVRIPTDPRVQEVWLERIGNDKLFNVEQQKLTSSHRICLRHFHKMCLLQDTRLKLMHLALPTIDLPGFGGISNKHTCFLPVEGFERTLLDIKESNPLKRARCDDSEAESNAEEIPDSRIPKLSNTPAKFQTEPDAARRKYVIFIKKDSAASLSNSQLEKLVSASNNKNKIQQESAASPSNSPLEELVSASNNKNKTHQESAASPRISQLEKLLSASNNKTKIQQESAASPSNSPLEEFVSASNNKNKTHQESAASLSNTKLEKLVSETVEEHIIEKQTAVKDERIQDSTKPIFSKKRNTEEVIKAVTRTLDCLKKYLLKNTDGDNTLDTADELFGQYVSAELKELPLKERREKRKKIMRILNSQ